MNNKKNPIKILTYNQFISEAKSTRYKKDDIVLIEYWYNDMVTPVKILEVMRGKYKISHNIEQSKIFNAPDEVIKNADIISLYHN